ncbi:MAG: hypothetical protein M9894_39675 [Planctomycetes bacterium]|nr:hypothetical protein [Planctomycetota bacterium]
MSASVAPPMTRERAVRLALAGWRLSRWAEERSPVLPLLERWLAADQVARAELEEKAARLLADGRMPTPVGPVVLGYDAWALRVLVVDDPAPWVTGLLDKGFPSGERFVNKAEWLARVHAAAGVEVLA